MSGLYVGQKEMRMNQRDKDTSSTGKDDYVYTPRFDACNISLTPFTSGVTTKDGIMFDLVNLLPYIKKHGVHPILKTPLAAKDIIRVHVQRNDSGEIICPCTFKVLNKHSHVIVVGVSGNLYSYDALRNMKGSSPGTYADFKTNQEFKLKDVITIQDPAHPRKFSSSNMPSSSSSSSAAADAAAASTARNIRGNATMNAVLEQLKKQESAILKEHLEKLSAGGESSKRSSFEFAEKKIYEKRNQNSGCVARSFTSTGVSLNTKQDFTTYSDKELRTILYAQLKRSKEKTYARLHTSLGDINLQLHSDLVPMTVHNFVLNALRGEYDGSIFHRVIPGFMIQGGAPKGSEPPRGGRCAWGKSFPDEFHPTLTHSTRGIVSMANSGKDTNASQFFLTFDACSHLDKKHSVFGYVVGGAAVLDVMEKVEIDSKTDRPVAPIVIHKITLFVNPYNEEVETPEVLADRRALQEKEDAKREQEQGAGQRQWFSAPQPKQQQQQQRDGIGKYMATHNKKRKHPSSSSSSSSSALSNMDATQQAILLGPSSVGYENRKKKKKGKFNFDNF